MNARDPDRPRVLILGGGFGGIGAARKLHKADAEVVLVDSHDYHTFQPMLYQVATDLIDTSEVAHPLRDLFHDQPNAAVHQATATSIDLERRRVEFDQMAAIDYDYLVLGIGARVNFFGVEGAAEHGFPMYTLTDAVELKEHVLRRWEAADRDPSLVDDGALHIVVVGGGPTGVESVGALAELYRSDFAKDYPSLPMEKARLTLVEAGPSLFTMFEPEAPGICPADSRGLGGRGPALRGGVGGRADARDPEVRARAQGSHARLGRRAPGAARSRRRWASSSSTATGSRSGPISVWRRTRRCSRSET